MSGFKLQSNTIIDDSTIKLKSYPRSFTIDTPTNNYNLFNNSLVRQALIELYGYNDDAELSNNITNGLTNLYFLLKFENSRVSINNTPYTLGDLFIPLFSSEDFLEEPIYSITIENANTSVGIQLNVRKE